MSEHYIACPLYKENSCRNCDWPIRRKDKKDHQCYVNENLRHQSIETVLDSISIQQNLS